MPARILVCLHRRFGTGASCGDHGGAVLYEALRVAVEGRGLPCAVEAVHCFGQCARGANVRLAGGPFFHDARLDQVDEILAAAVAFTAARSAPGS